MSIEMGNICVVVMKCFSKFDMSCSVTSQSILNIDYIWNICTFTINYATPRLFEVKKIITKIGKKSNKSWSVMLTT